MDEPVIRHVPVEGGDDPVAVGRHVPQAIDGVSMGIRETCDVQPVSGQALPEMRRCQQPIDLSFVCPGGAIGQEGVGFRDRRRQPGQVKAQPAQQHCRGCLPGWGNAFRFQTGEDEPVDGMLRHLQGIRDGRVGLHRLHKGPVWLVNGALFDPSNHKGLLPRGEGEVRCRRGHDVFRVCGQDAPDDFAPADIGGDDGVPAGTFRQGCKGRSGLVEPEAGLHLRLVRSVAGKAFIRQYRLHMPVEINLSADLPVLLQHILRKRRFTTANSSHDHPCHNRRKQYSDSSHPHCFLMLSGFCKIKFPASVLMSGLRAFRVRIPTSVAFVCQRYRCLSREQPVSRPIPLSVTAVP